VLLQVSQFFFKALHLLVFSYFEILLLIYDLLVLNIKPVKIVLEKVVKLLLLLQFLLKPLAHAL
jgi:hypothetical protein